MRIFRKQYRCRVQRSRAARRSRTSKFDVYRSRKPVFFTGRRV
jgi:hypothetical protein